MAVPNLCPVPSLVCSHPTSAPSTAPKSWVSPAPGMAAAPGTDRAGSQRTHPLSHLPSRRCKVGDWGVWVHPAALVSCCLSPILVHPSARGDTGSPRGDPASCGGAGHLVTATPAPRRVTPGLGRTSRGECSKAVLGGIIPQRDGWTSRCKRSPWGGPGHPISPESCLVLEPTGAASLWHYLLQPAPRDGAHTGA